MTANDIFLDSRVAHVRELKNEVARLKAELTAAQGELASVREHLNLALLAARDADSLEAGGRFVIVDGWNALLGSASVLSAGEKRLDLVSKERILCDRVTALLAARPKDRGWIVFDGKQAGGREEGRLRVSWTGGTGAHRADRMVCDFLRMRRWLGKSGDMLVLTEDKDFARTARALGATVEGVKWLNN